MKCYHCHVYLPETNLFNHLRRYHNLRSGGRNTKREEKTPPRYGFLELQLTTCNIREILSRTMLRQFYECVNQWKALGVFFTFKADSMLVKNPADSHKVLIQISNGESIIKSKNRSLRIIILFKWLSVYIFVNVVVSVKQNLKIPISSVPFAVLYVWTQNFEVEKFAYDYFGFSVGQIPLTTERNVHPNDIIDVNGKIFQYISCIGKVR